MGLNAILEFLNSPCSGLFGFAAPFMFFAFQLNFKVFLGESSRNRFESVVLF
jgi:hypothetical protein